MGPLTGTRVVELAATGPVAFTGMMLSDMGADVIRVDRVGPATAIPTLSDPEASAMHRGRRSLAVDAKDQRGRRIVLRLVADADILLEGFRPGVTERMGLGPEDCRAVNERLVYGRLTGWGQGGPHSADAGHDINYVALTGVLGAIGSAGGPPVLPLSLLGDIAGGAMFLAFGVLCGLIEARTSGQGQVVDAAMIDGVATMATGFSDLVARGGWSEQRGSNLLDGGAPFYDVYECADGEFVAVGALEPPFFDELAAQLGITLSPMADRADRGTWPQLRRQLASAFLTKTRDEWCQQLEYGDACVTPVLSWSEAPRHPHNQARRVFVDHAGVTQPAPAPRFSRSPGAIAAAPPSIGEHTDEILAELGLSVGEVEAMREAKVVV